MNITDFMRANKPLERKPSVLMPYLKDILVAKDNGYTNSKIVRWLALNEVTVSRQALAAFIKRQTKAKQSDDKTDTGSSRAGEPKAARSDTSQAGFGKSARQRREEASVGFFDTDHN